MADQLAHLHTTQRERDMSMRLKYEKYLPSKNLRRYFLKEKGIFFPLTKISIFY